MCNCIKGTREINVIDKYVNLLGHKIEGTQLTLNNIELDNGVLYGTFTCDCGIRCKKKFASVYYKHTVTCGNHFTSKGEVAVKQVLDKLGIEYRQQVTLNDLRNKRGNKLKFDFAIKLGEHEYGVIEYDGEQHYDPSKCDFRNHEVDYAEFEKIQSNDRIKDEYCKANGYKMLRLREKHFRHNVNKIENEIQCH